MTYTRSFCDKCQREVDTNAEMLHKVCLLEHSDDWLKYELCDDCYKRLRKWLRDPEVL